MKLNENRDFLLSVYTECHENARWHPQHRDQIMIFYGAVCAFYFSQISKTSDTMFYILSITMIILGLVCSIIVIDLRSLTLQYGKAAELIGMILFERKSSLYSIEWYRELRSKKDRESPYAKPFILRMGNLIVFGFIIITLAPFAIICDHIASQTKTCCLAIVFCLSCAVVYFAILMRLFFRHVKQADNEYYKTWIIRFLDEDT